jgi:hypothetical protein
MAGWPHSCYGVMGTSNSHAPPQPLHDGGRRRATGQRDRLRALGCGYAQGYCSDDPARPTPYDWMGDREALSPHVSGLATSGNTGATDTLRAALVRGDLRQQMSLSRASVTTVSSPWAAASSGSPCRAS